MKRLVLSACFFFILSSTFCFGGERCDHASYFDARTGHKYIKINANEYAEYSRKGIFLKNVPSDLPLLLNSSNIHPINDNHYILYEKFSSGASNQKFLPGTISHPEGWRAKRLFLSLN